MENLSVGSNQHLDIQKTEIPDQFERLMKEVTHQYGIPLSYMRVHQANLLEMTIPPRSKRGKNPPENLVSTVPLFQNYQTCGTGTGQHTTEIWQDPHRQLTMIRKN